MESQTPEKLDLRSHDIAADKQAALRAAFPEVFTEGGKIDFERLKAALGENVDAGKERYGMNWPGKADCFKTIQQPSMATLVPVKAESVAWDTTENLIIEGDNLEVLKLLQKSYLGRVKMIYIDPPYNTGNDFIYPDNYAESLETYLRYTGQVDSEGRKYATNTEADGRFHSKWLNMMYPRLYLARNLLREDGVIFISIDDHEVENLRRLCNEIFGEENAVGIVCWKNVTDNNPTLINKDNEFVLCYAKMLEAQPEAWRSGVSEAKDLLQAEFDRLKAEKLPLSVIEERIRDFISDNSESLGFLTRYKNIDGDGIYTGSESVHNPRAGGYDFEVLHPTTGLPMRKPANGYRFPEATFREMEKRGVILYGEDERRIVKIKKYLSDYEDTLRSVIVMDGRLGSYDVKRLFEKEGSVFTNPKPVELIKSFVSYAADKESIVLDFFGGSGTTAHAVLELNRADNGQRKFILVQLPEPTERNDFPTIVDITKERVRRVCARLEGSREDELAFETGAKQDRGFKVFKLQSSNFKTWNADVPKDSEPEGRVAALAQQLEMHVHHIVEGRTPEDLLYEILLKSGFPPTTPIEYIEIAREDAKNAKEGLALRDASNAKPFRDFAASRESQGFYCVAEGAMLICLETQLTPEVIKEMAARKPERVVCLDEGFAGNDQLKTNAVQTMKTKGVTSFRTV